MADFGGKKKPKPKDPPAPPASRGGSNRPPASPSGPPDVMFRTCDLFNETMTARSEGNPILPQKLEEFQASKIKEKTSPYGGGDRPFASNGQFAGFKHAHLTHDVSVVYKMHSSNPTLIDLYGVFTHDDLGTGSPPARRTQANMLKRFNRQEFT